MKYSLKEYWETICEVWREAHPILQILVLLSAIMAIGSYYVQVILK